MSELEQIAGGRTGAERVPEQTEMMAGRRTFWAVVGEAASYAVLVVAMVACGFGTSFTLTGATSTVMGAAQGGYGAMALAAFHPDRYRYAGSLSGFLTPSATSMNDPILSRAITLR